VTDNLPSISVVIPTGGHRRVTESSVRAVLDDSGTTEVLLIIVPEEGETEVAGPVVQQLQRVAETEPRLRIEPLPPDDGSGLWRVQRARDLGVRMARSELILALDDDVVLDRGAVSGHAAAHIDDPDLVLLGYMPVATKQQWPRGNATVRHYGLSYERHCVRYEEHPDEILKSLWGGNVSLRRDRWLEAVKRPRTTAWGHDDKELGLLFLRDGMHGRFDRTLRGRHYYTRSLAGFFERAEKSPIGSATLIAANTDLLEKAPGGPGRMEAFAAPILAVSRAPVVWSLIRSTLTGLMALLGALRLTSLGDYVAQFVWTLVARRSVRTAGVSDSY
jgi:Glycosyltransferase like family 2